MKLRQKMMLLTGVTAALILAAVTVLVIVCFFSFFSQIREEGHRYAVNDLRVRTRANMFRMRDVVHTSYLRTAAFFIGMDPPLEDLFHIVKTQFSRIYGVDAALLASSEAGKPDVFPIRYGLLFERDEPPAETGDFPSLLRSPELAELIRNTGASGRTEFLFPRGEIWIVASRPELDGSGRCRIFALRLDHEYLNSIAVARNEGFILMYGDRIVEESFDAETVIPETMKQELRRVAGRLGAVQGDELITEQLPDTAAGHEWFATGVCLKPSPNGPYIRLVRLYQYDSVMPGLPKLLQRQFRTLIVASLILMVLSVGLLLFPLFFVSRQISNPIAQAVSFAEAVASGDFTPRPEGSCGILEIDRLLKSLDYLRDRLNAMIGKLKRSHLREQKARKNAEDINHLKSDFLTVLYWEFREPLNTVDGFSTLLEDKLTRKENVDAEFLEPMVRAIRGNVSSMSKLCEVLRELSVLDIPESGSVHRENTDTFQMFHELNTPLLKEASARGIELEFRYSSDLPPRIFVDKEKTQRMLTLLIEAMIGGIHKKGSVLTCSCGVHEGKMVFRCSGTTGNPLPLEYGLYRSAGRPLREFRTADGIILLTIVRYISGILESSFDVSSDDSGYAVTVSIPLDKSARKSADAAHETEIAPLFTGQANEAAPGGPEGSNRFSGAELQNRMGRPPRVLVAEDDKSNRLLFEAMLRGGNCTVTSCSDMTETRRQLEESMPDILLLDLHMRDLDRFPFLSEVRRMERGRDLCIIVLAAYLADGDRDRLISAGADSCLLKPLDMEDLIGAVRTFLKKKQQNPS